MPGCAGIYAAVDQREDGGVRNISIGVQGGMSCFRAAGDICKRIRYSLTRILRETISDAFLNIS